MHFKTFASSVSNYSISYPADWIRLPDWQTDEKQSANANEMTVSNNSNKYPITLTVFYVKHPLNIKDEVDAINTRLAGDYKDLKINSSESLQPNWDWYTSYTYSYWGMPAYEEYYYKLSPTGQMYRISIFCARDTYNSALFKKVVNSFKIMKH
jgi:hypothetical protein